MIIKFVITFDTNSGKYESEAQRIDLPTNKNQEENVDLMDLSNKIVSLFTALSKKYVIKITKQGLTKVKDVLN